MDRSVGVKIGRSVARIALLIFGVISVAAQAQIQVTDETGAVLTLRRPAERIVALAPSLVENIFAAGAGDKLVGAVTFSDYPPEAKKIPRVGSYSHLDFEALLALKPDLVIAWEGGNPPAMLDKIRAFGIPMYLSSPNKLEKIGKQLLAVGALAGSDEIAIKTVSTYRARLATLEKKYAGKPIVSTFYQIYKQPLITVGGQQIISHLITLCGGRNVFENLTKDAPVVGIESVLLANPQAIITSGMNESRPEWLDDWKRWPSLTAVKQGNLFFVPPDLIQRPTLRLLEGAERLCKALEVARNAGKNAGN